MAALVVVGALTVLEVLEEFFRLRALDDATDIVAALR
jgi:hypothetical protein